MFVIEATKNNENVIDNLVMKHSKSATFAMISLTKGASLQKLQFDGITVITSPKHSDYENNFASSILFPFTNRIENGIYKFNEQTFQLVCNKKGENNAIHGLVHDKTFEIVHSKQTSKFAQVRLRYTQLLPISGFPFKYGINIIYTLSKKQFSAEVIVENCHTNVFPFAIGWHPYFESSDLKKSRLQFLPKQHILNNSNFVPATLQPLSNGDLYFNQNYYDDAYFLDNSKVYLETPDYKLKIESTSLQNYLQVYTNAIETNLVAIEPMTAPANCFNNGMGIQFLKPEDSYKVKWHLHFKNFKK